MLVAILAFSAGFLVSRHQSETFTGLAWLAAGGMLGTLLLTLVLWLLFRRTIVKPLKAIGVEAAKMASGDLSFEIDLRRRDDLGRLQDAIKESLRSVSGILRRVAEVTGRVGAAADQVEKESARVAAYTEMEATAVADISSSVEELNASIKEIAGNVEGLAGSVEESATSMEQMAASIESVGLIVHDLTGGVEATSSSIEELSATIREVADGAGELASVSETTLSAVERIVSSITDIELKAKESARLSQRVTEEASTMGVSAMEKTTSGMARIRGAVEETARTLEKLGGRSEEIGKIVTFIDDIAGRTKLLALNAAILSAQAGEKGKGFSVVAEEMKELAQKTAFSTREIATLIDAVQDEVQSSVDSMNGALESVAEGTALSREAADSFGKILESALSSSEMTLSIERSSAEQAQAALLVSESIEKERIMVQRMARATSEQARGIALIVRATEKIRDASLQVRSSSDQQRQASGMLARTVDVVSDRTRQIANAINEQKAGTGQIWAAVEQIKEIPRQSKDIAFRVNRTLREVVKDVEIISYEMGSFKLHEEHPGVIRFGIMPRESPVEMYKRYTPLARYLGQRLGRKVELRVAPNFETALRELGGGVTSLCALTSMLYIEARKEFGAQTLATVRRNGNPWQHSVIVARADRRIRSAQELKGGSFAFVDEKAATGYVMPRAMLMEEGVDLKDLSYYNFTGAHDEVARAVLRGEFDAGGVMESTARKYLDQGLAILKVSERAPEWNICCRGLGDALQSALLDALLDLKEADPEGAAVLRAIEPDCTGFSRSTDDDHDGMRSMMSRIGIF